MSDVCAYCGMAEGHSKRCSVRKCGADEWRMPDRMLKHPGNAVTNSEDGACAAYFADAPRSAEAKPHGACGEVHDENPWRLVRDIIMTALGQKGYSMGCVVNEVRALADEVTKSREERVRRERASNESTPDRVSVDALLLKELLDTAEHYAGTEVRRLARKVAADRRRERATPKPIRSMSELVSHFEDLGNEPCGECGYALNELRDYVHEVLALRKVAEAAREVVNEAERYGLVAFKHGFVAVLAELANALCTCTYEQDCAGGFVPSDRRIPDEACPVHGHASGG